MLALLALLTWVIVILGLAWLIYRLFKRALAAQVTANSRRVPRAAAGQMTAEQVVAEWQRQVAAGAGPHFLAKRPELLPKVFWRCVVCSGEEYFVVRWEKTGFLRKSRVLVCLLCGTKWVIGPQGMTMTKGPLQHQGFKTYFEWEKIFTGLLTITARRDVEVPIILKEEEGVVKVGRAVLLVERSKVVRGFVPAAGVSFPLGKRVRGHAGGLFPTTYERVSETRPADEGEFILTNQRVVFNGRRRPAAMDLKKIVSVGVSRGVLTVAYGRKTYWFDFPSESPGKWQTYIEAVAKAAAEGKSLRAK